MFVGREQFKSSYGAFAARERELERNRARRDARDDTRDAVNTERKSAPAVDRTAP